MDNPSQTNATDEDQQIEQETTKASSDTLAMEDLVSLTRRKLLAGGAAVGLGLSAGRTRAETEATAGTTTNVSAGHLNLKLKNTNDGIHLQSLYDGLDQRELLAAQPGPLWKVSMYNPATDYTSGERAMLRADEAWEKAEIERDDEAAKLKWQGAQDDRFTDITVIARIEPQTRDNALHWNLNITNDSDWSIEQVAFPQAGLREMENGNLFTPDNEGSVIPDPWPESEEGTSFWNDADGHDTITFEYMGHYYNLNYFSVYDPSTTGLYFGLHDSAATHKGATAKSPSKEQGVRLRFRHPAPDMVVGGNNYELSGAGVWRLYEGDWYDAAQIYRDWAQAEAPWFTEPGSGEKETAPWMQDGVAWLIMWTRQQEDIEPMVEQAKEFAEYMDVPVGVHWYAWYEHHHDDNNPRFPSVPKDGFGDAVEELQDAGVRVMPYTNVRTWDADLDSFETTGRPGASKAPNGEPYIRERPHADMAVMDPSTDIWQDRLRENTLAMFDEHGVDAVYLDLLGFPANAAADRPAGFPPRWRREFGQPTALCCDPTHGHPLGGGHWWTDGYREVLDDIRDGMPNDGALSCENTPEPYVDKIDGLLSWTWGERWGYQKGSGARKVPAFVAVYGGVTQEIVRGLGKVLRSTENIEQYGGKARQQMAMMLTYGNQLGWFKPTMLEVESMAEYARRITSLRHELSQYFVAGRMRRPPTIDVPTDSAQWNDHGGYTKTMDAVLTTAWEHSDDRLVLPFVNWTDQSITTTVDIDLTQYGFEDPVSVRKIGPDGPTGERFTVEESINREVTFDARTGWAWEVQR